MLRAGGRTWKGLYQRGQCSVKLSESLFAALQWMVDGSSVPILIGNWNCVSMVATRLQRKCVFPKMKPCRTGNLCLRHFNGWLMVLQAICCFGQLLLANGFAKRPPCTTLQNISICLHNRFPHQVQEIRQSYHHCNYRVLAII